ncbi:MAG TPA: ABC transporter permease [Ktedonobacterales bacterium]|nr:ABC transporter permease [Ktedonobacterales bacterium]
MSATLTVSPAAASTATNPHTARPSFIGLVRGEFLKVSRQLTTWLMLLALAGVVVLPFLIALTVGNLKADIQAEPLADLYRFMGQGLTILRVFSGPVLIIVTARLIGMEYSSGTIRVLLGRGVGRIQLLAAKLLTVFLIAAAILAAGMLLEYALSLFVLRAVTGNLDALKAINGTFWADTRVYVATVAISMAVTILMAAAITVVARSLAGGLSASIAWFPADNIGLVFFILANLLTKSDFWLLVTGDLLGPNLNAMPRALLSAQAPGSATRVLEGPLVPVDGGHTLLVSAIYAAIFLAVAVVLTWRRDVKE